MNKETAANGALLLLGILLIISAPAAEDETNSAIIIQERVNESQLPSDSTVVEFDSLNSSTRSAFLTAIEEGSAELQSSPSDRLVGKSVYIHYQDSYYEIGVTVDDTVDFRKVLFVGILGGIITVAAIGWWITRVI